MKTTIIIVAMAILAILIQSCTGLRVNGPGEQYGPSDHTMWADLNRLYDGIKEMPVQTYTFNVDNNVKINIEKQNNGYKISVIDQKKIHLIEVHFCSKAIVENYIPYLLRRNFCLNKAISLYEIKSCILEKNGKKYDFFPDYLGGHNGRSLFDTWVSDETPEREELNNFLDSYLYKIEDGIENKFNIIFAD